MLSLRPTDLGFPPMLLKNRFYIFSSVAGSLPSIVETLGIKIRFLQCKCLAAHP